MKNKKHRSRFDILKDMLGVIRENNGLSVSHISRKINLEHNACRGVLDLLEKHDFLYIEYVPKRDKYGRDLGLYKLTQMGQALWFELNEFLDKFSWFSIVDYRYKKENKDE